MNLNKVYNLRDAGGYPCSGGRFLKNQMIYRSGQPDKAGRGDREWLTRLGIRTVIDLRPEKERIGVPACFSGARRLLLGVDITSTTIERLKPHLFKRNREGQIIAAVSSVYHNMPDLFLPHLPVLFETLSQPASYPVLFHCRGGKDRTGVIIALIQMLMGVSDQDVMREYLLTNEFLLPRARRTLKIMNLFAFGALPMKNYEIAYAAREEYLNAFRERITRAFGSPSQYLEAAGVPGQVVEQMRVALSKR